MSLLRNTRYFSSILKPTLKGTRLAHRSLYQISESRLLADVGKRMFSSSSVARHGHLKKPTPGEELHITFVLKDGTQKDYEVSDGDTILDIAQGNNIDMEGACGGSCACSTCHVIVDPDYIDALPEPTDDENDMLDLAYGLTETSRLGCQIKMSKDIDGIRVALPAMTRNVSNNDFN